MTLLHGTGQAKVELLTTSSDLMRARHITDSWIWPRHLPIPYGRTGQPSQTDHRRPTVTLKLDVIGGSSPVSFGHRCC